jgi:omega-6 fatty acid desaturase (delta-12 desaturase)
MKNDSVSSETISQPGAPAWKTVVAKYQRPAVWRSVWQLVNTLVPYAALWYLIHLSLPISYWLTVPLVLLAGGFQVRIFIVFHDCGHGSFFKSRKANDIVGCLTGLLCLTSYFHWRWEHAVHHSTSGDLDRRGTGDVWTLTVQEYLEASRWKRFAYRLARNPLVLFVVAPLFLFVVRERFPTAGAGRRERRSVYWTNLAILVMGGGLSLVFGLKAYLVIQLAVAAVAASAGVWLFYVQHQFEGVYWERGEDWDYVTAALKGSSFYKLPGLLQWFSGNIGFHHIHHLSPRIPNYYLPKCHQAEPLFQSIQPVTLISSLKSLSFRLWDEQCRKLVGYGALKKVRHWGAFAFHEQTQHVISMPELSVQVEVQLAQEQVWMRLEGTLSPTSAEGLGQRIRDSLARTSSRLVLDLNRLQWDKVNDLRPLREKLAAYRSRIRLILPKLAAAHPEVILLAGMFQHYKG